MRRYEYMRKLVRSQKRVLKAIEAGATYKEVSKRFKVNTACISAWVQAAGMRKFGGLRRTPKQKKMLAMIEAGAPANQIAEECKCTRAYIYYVKARLKVEQEPAAVCGHGCWS